MAVNPSPCLQPGFCKGFLIFFLILTVTMVGFYSYWSFVLHVVKVPPLAKILQLLMVGILVLFASLTS